MWNIALKGVIWPGLLASHQNSVIWYLIKVCTCVIKRNDAFRMMPNKGLYIRHHEKWRILYDAVDLHFSSPVLWTQWVTNENKNESSGNGCKPTWGIFHRKQINPRSSDTLVSLSVLLCGTKRHISVYFIHGQSSFYVLLCVLRSKRKLISRLGVLEKERRKGT